MREVQVSYSRPNLNLPLALGVGICLSFLAIAIIWGAYAPLSSAAIATGELSVKSKRKSIAHLEGGIVSSIYVSEGDSVKKDQVLLELDGTQAKSTLALVEGRFFAAKALEARLEAEQLDQDGIRFDDVLMENESRPEVKKMLVTQLSIFEARITALKERQNILARRIEQYRSEIKGLMDEITAQTQHLRFLKEEIEALEGLINKGMAGRSRMLELQREAAEVEGLRARNEAAIARAEQDIAESELEVNRLSTDRLNQVVMSLRDTQAELFDLKEQMRAARDIVNRTTVKAPIAGTIVDLKIHTIGGVVASGEPLLDIVPSDEQLIIDARVKPKDIDVVYLGMSAKVRITAFNLSRHEPLAAEVTSVSADRLLDDRSGEPYYRVELRLLNDTIDAARSNNLHPGMQVEVLIITGRQTMLNYITEPLLIRLNRAFRDS